MICGLLLVGFLSAFALGPSSFNIIRTLLSKRTWPWRNIAGFLAADLMLIATSLLLLNSPFLSHPLSKTILTLMTVLALSFYGLWIIFLPASLDTDSRTLSQDHFTKSFLLGLSNVHLILIYSGLFINVTTDGDIPYRPAILYFGSFLISFLSLLWLIRRLSSFLMPLLRRLELLAAFGFLIFSVYLALEIL